MGVASCTLEAQGPKHSDLGVGPELPFPAILLQQIYILYTIAEDETVSTQEFVLAKKVHLI